MIPPGKKSFRNKNRLDYAQLHSVVSLGSTRVWAPWDTRETRNSWSNFLLLQTNQKLAELSRL